MRYIQLALVSAIRSLSDKSYEKSLAYFRFWSGIGHTYSQTPSDLIFDTFFTYRAASDTAKLTNYTYPAAQLIVRLVNDAESDPVLAPHSTGLRSRFCTGILKEFFDEDLAIVYNTLINNTSTNFYVNTNLISHCVNLGYIDEDTVHNRILQSLISHTKVLEHQVIALAILFKIAGATFEAYVDPAVVDRCFELITNHQSRDEEWVALKQEVIKQRDCGWEDLPSPAFKAGKSKSAGGGQKDPSATPVATSLGLPKGDLEPQIPHPHLPPLELVTAPETDAAPTSTTTRSPSVSISTISDFTIADTSDDEFPIDPTTITPHDTFHLEDGNVEVLCGNTLFRVHTSVLSFHSPTLRQMFAQTNLASAESPNGCPRILSSDSATDFTMLLKMIYLPGFPERGKIPDFTTFSSLLRITTKYELPTVQSRLHKVVRNAYPESFEGLTPSKPLGESVFSGPTPHPNEVLNLFVQQKLTSALPMAYYMAARRGIGSLMDRSLPRSATLSPDILQSAITGLMALREAELNETHRLIFEPKGSRPCSAPKCPSHTPTSPAALDAYQKVLSHVVGSSRLGTKVLQVPEFYENHGGDLQCVSPNICGNCVQRWESGHVELRKRVWAKLQDVFGLKS